MSRSLAACFVVVVLIGCSQPASDLPATATSATPVAFNVAGAPTVEFSVPDMMCPDGCGVKVKEILSQQPGAKEVVINFESKTAIVAIEREQFDADAAIAALVDHRFEHSAINQEQSNNPTSESPATAADAERHPG